MNAAELKRAILTIEKERHISADVLIEAIENALLAACKSYYKSSDNVRVQMDRETCDLHLIATKEVVETRDDVMDPIQDIALEDAQQIDPAAQIGDQVDVEIDSREFSRISATSAKNVIMQKIREEERISTYNYYLPYQRTVMTGTVDRNMGRNIAINLGRSDGFLNEKEQVPGEVLRTGDLVKVYVLDVKQNTRGTRIQLSRTHPELVRCLFEKEVTEIQDGTVEIRSIAREAGSRTKVAVFSNNPGVDPIGACVGPNGSRVNAVVDQLGGEKIDIVSWDENPGNFIQNALSPAKIVAVFADPEEKTAKVVVPDYQLSLAIGREGQNARLAAKLTGYKIDIKSETQAKDAPGFRYEDYESDEYEDDEDELELGDELEAVDEGDAPLMSEDAPAPEEQSAEDDA